MLFMISQWSNFCYDNQSNNYQLNYLLKVEMVIESTIIIDLQRENIDKLRIIRRKVENLIRNVYFRIGFN